MHQGAFKKQMTQGSGSHQGWGEGQPKMSGDAPPIIEQFTYGSPSFS